MEVQNFLLRYARVQTHARAILVFKAELERWRNFFARIAVDYFGDLFVETTVLKKALAEEMAGEQSATTIRRMHYIFTYEGQKIINEAEFMHIMRFWASFSVNVINCDN